MTVDSEVVIVGDQEFVGKTELNKEDEKLTLKLG